MKNKMFIMQVITLIVGLLGMLMLVSGAVLYRLDEASRRTPDKVQMPEEYIEEFFGNENSEPNIEDYIEPEADD